jgi:gluconate 2-dehydrogenase alpha chain
MATRKPAVDAVICGFGATGALVAEALTAQGLRVVALERGSMLTTAGDFAPAIQMDELRFQQRHGLMVQPAQSTQTFRYNSQAEALPMRDIGAWQIGTGVGGSATHWAGQAFRLMPDEFRLRSHLTARYGADLFPDDMTSQDWAVSYDELEPFYDRYEKLLGVSGQAGNLRGTIIPGGNPLEGPRSDHYPNPPLLRMKSTDLFDQTAKSLGLHPYPCAAAQASRPYTNPLGVRMGACTYCGFCSGFGCGNYSKSSPQTTILPVVMQCDGFELRVRSVVTRILTDNLGKHATGVEYVDASGETFEQPADMVFVCSFTLANSHLLLVSGIGEAYDPATGKGTVGRNYAFQLWGASDFLLAGQTFDPWIGAGGLGQIIDDYDCDNFDHRAVPGKPFVGGGYIGLFQYGNQPIGTLAPGSGKDAMWGSALKRKMADTYAGALQVQAMGANQSYKDCYLSLDPTYKDPYGRPLLRVTYDIKENDRLMSRFLVDQCERIAKAMGGKILDRIDRASPFDTTQFQTTHNSGGTAASATPDKGVVNKFGQTWSTPNVFVYGASQFPQTPGRNPTMTVGATTLLGLDAVVKTYVKSPGAMVPA